MRGSIRTPKAVNAGLLAIAVALAVVIAAGSDSELLFWLILLSAGALGVLAVVPIGGADMPVVISTLNAFTGLSAAAAGIALDNTALIVAGMLVGASGSILTKQMADAMNRSIANVFFAGRRHRRRRALDRARAAAARRAPRAPPTSPSSSPTPAWSSSCPATAWPSPRPSAPSPTWRPSSRSAASRSCTGSIPSPAGCPAT